MPASPRRPSVDIRIGHRRVSGTGMARSRLGDVYHLCLSASWPRLLAGYAVVFVLINLGFTALYLLDAHAVVGQRAPRAWDVLFFSVEVFGTVSFGGFMPGSVYGHAVASLEILCGIVSYAFVTGLTFARFTRATAGLVFAEHPVVMEYEGRPTLVTRVANQRHTLLGDARVKLWIALNDVRDGRLQGRRSFRARLLRDDMPMLPLSWLIYHTIDDESPLHGLSRDELRMRDVGLIYIVSAYDETYAQETRATHLYHCDDIRWNHVFVDTLFEIEPGEVQVDFSKFHDTRPAAAQGGDALA